MGFLFDAINKIITRAMKSEAENILFDLKAACPKRTGDTARSFRIMDENYPSGVGVFSGSVFVGSDKDTARWADEGNGPRGARLYANHYRADGRPPALGKWDKGIPGYGWRTSVSTYEGKGFVEEVAKKYR